ncbi:MAG: bifunctional demethylmenaquinone methyltransferase/2-methoxy-6-polyprenyl-1,4-benzoquinol methylase UbiE [Lewinellaceae bacterium]|nr:bifunctional demethylmenaquinone methyltransferase/2-methoxy-6-polyprenyl-1,4-benzoquinol methylase UbiE [Lewinellaceae bacterium]
MTVTPYNTPTESKKGQVERMFDKIAPFYDFLNHFLSLGIDIWWRKKAIRYVKDNQPNRILDIATGTADLALEAAKTIQNCSIVGVDISEKMLEIGKEKIKKDNFQHRISLEIGDSEQLQFQDATYDAVMSAFGVRNFENLEKGLSEMYRVLAPNGTLMILEFSKPKTFPLKQLFDIYFKNFLPVIGRFKSKDKNAYRYLYESVQQFPSFEEFTKVLNQVGFQNTQYKSLTGGICAIYLAKK